MHTLSRELPGSLPKLKALLLANNDLRRARGDVASGFRRSIPVEFGHWQSLEVGFLEKEAREKLEIA